MASFKATILNIYGKRGRAWLEGLPSLLHAKADSYGLSHLTAISNLSYHYVVSGLQGDRPIVLKLGLDGPELKREAAALKAFEGYGAARLLAQEEGLILLEMAFPGDSLKSYFPLKEEDSLSIASQVMKRLHKAPVPQLGVFPLLTEWVKALDGAWEIPPSLLSKAQAFRDELVGRSSAPVLLHGDLHHDNILRKGEEWVVIDPKGVIGEPAYEAGAFIRNPIPGLLSVEEAQNLISHRIVVFSNLLTVPQGRILKWCLVQAVLSWIWSLEDRGDPSYFKHLTAVLEKI